MVLLALAAGGFGRATQSDPSLDDVMARVGEYVRDYGDTLTALVADEDYVQQLQRPLGGVVQSRTLRSEVEWIVSFDERRSPTIIRTTEGKNVRAKGRVWVEPETGRVTRTELVLDDFAPPVRSAFGDDEIRSFAEVTVTWRPEEALGAWVPAEMRERYEGPWGVGGDDPLMRLRYTVTGVAVYGDVRRADVDVRLIVPK